MRRRRGVAEEEAEKETAKETEKDVDEEGPGIIHEREKLSIDNVSSEEEYGGIYDELAGISQTLVSSSPPPPSPSWIHPHQSGGCARPLLGSPIATTMAARVKTSTVVLRDGTALAATDYTVMPWRSTSTHIAAKPLSGRRSSRPA